jgi:hypothetical protein
LYLELYPDHDSSSRIALYRQLFGGRPDLAEAGYDSLVAAHHKKDAEEPSARIVKFRDFDRYEFMAQVHQVREDHTSAMVDLERALAIGEQLLAPHHLIGLRLMLARSAVALDLHDVAAEQLDLILAVNPLLPVPLVLATEVSLARDDHARASRYLELLENLLVRADEDFPPLIEARVLRSRLDLAD